MAATTAGTTYASELMFAQMPLFLAGVEEDSAFYQRMQRGSAGVQRDGSKYYIKGTAITATGVGTRQQTSEGGAIASNATNTAVLPYWGLTTYSHKVLISGTAMQQGDLISMVDIKSVDMQAAMQDIAWHRNRLLMGSSSGYLCRAVGAGSSSTTLVVDDATALRVGMTIDSHTALTSGSTGITTQTISAIDVATNTVTLGGAETWADGDYIFVDDMRGYYGDNLQALMAGTSACTHGAYVITPAQATYAGLTKSSTANWDAYRQSLGGGNFDPKWWQSFMANAIGHQRVGQAGFTACYAHPQSVAALMEALPYEDKKMDEVVVYGNVKSIALKSPFLKAGSVDVVPIGGFWGYSLWFIDETDIGIRYPVTPGWDTEGGILKSNRKEYSGYDTYTAVFMGTEGLVGHPIKHAMLYDFNYIA